MTSRSRQAEETARDILKMLGAIVVVLWLLWWLGLLGSPT